MGTADAARRGEREKRKLIEPFLRPRELKPFVRVDEYFLAVFPIVLGSGKRLFREADQPRRLSLVDSRATVTGGVLLTYRPA